MKAVPQFYGLLIVLEDLWQIQCIRYRKTRIGRAAAVLSSL